MINFTFAFTLIVLACGHSTTAPATQPADLHALVGQRVHLEGRYDSGKLAHCVVVAGRTIYLMGTIDSDRREIAYDSIVAVEGVLGYHTHPPSTQPEGETPRARAPDHFYIENAKLRLLRHPTNAKG